MRFRHGRIATEAALPQRAVMTATTGVDGCCSAAVNTRPRAACTPSTSKNCASQVPDGKTSDGPPRRDDTTVPNVLKIAIAVEDMVPRAPVHEIRVRDVEAGSRPAFGQAHDTVGSSERQRLEQHAVDDGEDGRVRADTERERQDRGERESSAGGEGANA